MSSALRQRSAGQFIKRTKSWLAALILVAFIMIAQRISLFIYDIGLSLIIVAVTLGLTFNNLSEETNFIGVVKGLIVTWVIIGCVVAFSIIIAPFLTALGR